MGIASLLNEILTGLLYLKLKYLRAETYLLRI